jgi:dTDP-4-amino-4,6-dideoxy-D-galactose acyltransferase
MHQIQPLDWDTNFFGYKIGKLHLPQETIINTELLNSTDFDLVYIFAEQIIDEEHLKLVNANLYDIKIEFIQNIKTSLEMLPQTETIGNHEVEIKQITELSDNLLYLVLESGVYSRFKLDKNFKNKEFERLYRAWIEKTFIDKDGEVIGAYVNNDLIGFVSLSLKEGVAGIGLIAVHEKARGKHIGKTLLQASYNYAQKHQSMALTVVTQQYNNLAMQFYKNNGFEFYKKNYIYHLWKTIS